MINNIKKVYINGNTVVVKFKNGDSKVAKCHPKDKFDLEKGILLCLAQENGYTYKDIAELSESAINIKSCEKRKERKEKAQKVIKGEFFAFSHLLNYLTDLLKY